MRLPVWLKPANILQILLLFVLAGFWISGLGGPERPLRLPLNPS